MRSVFDGPNSERTEEINLTLKPMFRNVMKIVILNDLFSITEHDSSTYRHIVNLGVFATALGILLFKNDFNVEMDQLERLS